MQNSTDMLEAYALDHRVNSRPLSGRSKPPRRESPRFDKRSCGGTHNGMHRRGTRG